MIDTFYLNVTALSSLQNDVGKPVFSHCLGLSFINILHHARGLYSAFRDPEQRQTETERLKKKIQHVTHPKCQENKNIKEGMG